MQSSKIKNVVFLHTLGLEDSKILLHHYQSIYDDTTLLIQLCGQRRLTVAEGFVHVVERMRQLTAQVEYLQAAEEAKPQ